MTMWCKVVLIWGKDLLFITIIFVRDLLLLIHGRAPDKKE